MRNKQNKANMAINTIILLAMCLSIVTTYIRFISNDANSQTPAKRPVTTALLCHPAPYTIAARTISGTKTLSAQKPIAANPVETGMADFTPCDKVPLSDELQAALYDAANEFSVEYSVALSVIEHETRFQNLSGDSGSSIGYFQIQPQWWSRLMDEIGVTDLWDPAQNFRGGCAIIDYLTRHNGGLANGLHAYNPGYRDNNGNPYETVILSRVPYWTAITEENSL